jgi:UDP-N-acetylmuramoyl-tripeptide--D-alanyl-D-alanine ligase
VANALAAAAVGLDAGLSVAEVAAALTEAEASSRWRMEVSRRPDGLLVVNDAYNANPASMRAALEALVAIGERRGRRTVAVLGEMRELGPTSYDEHVGVGRAVAELGVDVLVTVGDEAAGIADGFGPETIVTAGRAEALAWVRENASGADVVLVKASRGAALEGIADGLVEGDGTAP